MDKIERAGERPDFDLELTEPFCAAYGLCGGCRGQHFTYDSQVRIKARPILETIQADYGFEPVFLPPPALRSYRDRMDFVVEGSVLGQRKAGDFDGFVDLERCEIQKEEGNRALLWMRSFLNEHPEIPYRRSENAGFLKYVTIRTGSGSGVLVLTVTREALEDPVYTRFREEWIKKGERERVAGKALEGFSLIETVSDSAESELSCLPDGRVLLGEPWFLNRLGGESYQVPYDSFFQPNPTAFDGLLSFATDHITSMLSGEDREALLLSDLYCGAGVLSSLFVRRFPGVFSGVDGVDFTESAIARAPEHFQNFSGKVNFVADDLNKPSGEIFRNGTPGLILVDPPRAGLSPAVRKAIIRSGAEFVVYFSCNPASQLADLKELESAYRPVAGALSDPYPHTPHLEQVLILRATG